MKPRNESMNKKAEHLYNDGMVQFKKMQFITARTCFHNALQKCSSGYKPRARFQKMKALAENCIKQDEENKQQNETAE
ncbi:unnamed protein product, partial [Allacma fusca]